MKKIKFIDLFAGIGGLRSGFENALKQNNIIPECVFTSEIKPHAVKVLEANYNHKVIGGDITKVNTWDIPDFDFLLAGFPCQSFSSAGKRLGFLDTRGTLFFEVERILKEKKPSGFILENVEGLIKHDRENKEDSIGRTLKTILMSLENLGYIVTWELLDSKEFGVPQSRKRIFIVGTLDEKISLKNFEVIDVKLKDVLENGHPTIESHFTKCLLKHYPIKSLYGKNIKDKRGGRTNIHSWDIELKGPVTKDQKDLLSVLLKQRRSKKWAEEIGIKWMDGMPLTLEQIETFYKHEELPSMLNDLVEKRYLKLEHPKDIFEGSAARKYREDLPKGYNIVAGKLSYEFSSILDLNGVAPTIVATDVNKLAVIDGNGLRRLTTSEGAKLFGFPAEFNFCDLDQDEIYDLLGNTVVIPVAEAVTTRLIPYIETIVLPNNTKREIDLFNYEEAIY